MTTPTPTQAANLQTGIAVAQTAYALNNGGGLQIGQPLMKVEDTSMVGLTGARPLNLDIPTGYTVRGLYKDAKTGLDVFMAFDAASKKVIIGVAGTNGIPGDKPDSSEDLSGTGVRHMEQLFELQQFKNDFDAVARSAGGVGNLSQVMWAGQSLGGAEAQLGGALAIHGVNGDPDKSLGLRPDQVSVVAVNSPGSDYGLKLLGLNQAQINSYYTGADIQSTISYNVLSGQADKVSYTGGGRGGLIWGMPVAEANSTSTLHRIAFAVAEAVDILKGDLTQLRSYSIDPWSHENISSNTFNLYGLVKVDNNAVSLSWAGYVSMLMSKPGEPTVLTTQVLTKFGVPETVAAVLGGVAETVLFRLPLTNPVGLVKALIGWYGVGRLLGSESTLEPTFEPVPQGYTRTNLTPPDTAAYAQGYRIVFDQNDATGSTLASRGISGGREKYYQNNSCMRKASGRKWPFCLFGGALIKRLQGLMLLAPQLVGLCG